MGVKLLDAVEGNWVLGYSSSFIGRCVGAELAGNGSRDFHEGWM